MLPIEQVTGLTGPRPFIMVRSMSTAGKRAVASLWLHSQLARRLSRSLYLQASQMMLTVQVSAFLAASGRD